MENHFFAVFPPTMNANRLASYLCGATSYGSRSCIREVVGQQYVGAAHFCTTAIRIRRVGPRLEAQFPCDVSDHHVYNRRLFPRTHASGNYADGVKE